MSFDFALAKTCSHEVLFEYLTLDPFSRNTLKFLRPPSNTAVKIRINGVDVPKAGLRSTPEFSTAPGPFRIRKGQNDRILFRYNSGPVREIQLQSNQYLTASDLVAFLRRMLPEVKCEVVGTKCQISCEPGNSFEFSDPRWTDRALTNPNSLAVLAGFKTLGIVPGRVFRSSTLFPAWDVVVNPNSYADDKAILFREPLRNGNPVIEVSYFTRDVDCRRCAGSGVEYDYSVQSNSFETIQNTDLLLQEFDKFLFTRAGSHWKWKWLGSSLSDRIGSKANATGQMANALIELDVQQAFQNFQNVKLQQDRVGFQRVSDAEFPFQITGLTVESPAQDPTVSLVKASITSRSRQSVETTRLVDGPASYFLPGSSLPFKLRG